MIEAIVGAGAAGMSLALLLDRPVPLYERESVPGGLCRSTLCDGFTFDQGPHILGGLPTAVDWIIESTCIDFVTGVTNNLGFVGGSWCEHPFANPDDGTSYMTKMWKLDPTQLSAVGLGAQPGRKPGGVSIFVYPKRGGYQAITDAWAAQLGEQITVDCTIATWAPGAVVTAPVPGARYNALGLVTLGFEGLSPTDLTAAYLPERWTPFHRLSFPSAFAEANAPDGCWSVQGEVSIAPDGAEVEGDPVELMRMTLDRVFGVAAEPVMQSVQRVEHAYPVPTGELTTSAVTRHGRTGAHRYINLDGVVAASMDLAAKLR